MKAVFISLVSDKEEIIINSTAASLGRLCHGSSNAVSRKPVRPVKGPGQRCPA